MTVDSTAPHGDLTCDDLEALLADTAGENDSLRDRLDAYQAADAARQVEQDDLRQEADRIRALLADMRKKTHTILDERAGLDEQVHLLLAELDAAERAALPTDTLASAAITATHMLATYRRASLITRGPLPPAIATAVAEHAADITEAMQEAGQAALEEVIRREVRRRRAATRTSRAA